ncbi:hypothetical protein BGZ58_008064 [Dissophora ornata]|nr:hypothetical protein BGZ58_008064 [Dissophora ornata]
MAEESRRPERTTSRLMIGSTICSLLAGLPLLIVLNYGITKPIKGLLDETLPGVRVILETLGNYTGAVFMAMVLVAIFCTGVIRLSMATRIVYSFARDGGVPHSSYWNHLHPQRKTPQRVSWLVTAACMCCIFPYFWGNTIAFQWIASLGCITSNICFVIPLWMRLTQEGNFHFIAGAFKLGRLSRPLHMISIAWLLFLSLFLMFPSTFPLSKNNFNYAPIVLVVLAIMFAVSWFKARTDFTGGAKDVSRASHRIPPSRPFKDDHPRKQQPYEMENLGPLLSPTYQTTSQAVVQKFKTPVAPEKTKSRHGHNFGTNPGPQIRQQQLRQHMHRPLEPLSPPRRGPIATAKRQQLKPEIVSRGANSEKSSRLGHQQRGQHCSNLTTTSISSNQSHPSSILGIPFSESPEMISQELAIKNSNPSSSPEPDLPDAIPLAAGSSPEYSSSVRSGLLLASPFTMNTNPQGLPEISVVPPTTESTTDATTSRSGGAQSKGDASTSSITPPMTTLHHDYSGNSISSSSEALTAQPVKPPVNAIDSIFNLSVGLTSRSIEKNSNTRGQGNGFGNIRSSKDRVPTPYPSSLEDGDDCGESASAGSMTEDQSPFPTGSITLSTLHKSFSRKPQEARVETDGRSDYSIEEIIGGMDIATPQQAVSRFPTLDGYPLLKSSSTVYIGGGGEGEATVRRGGRRAATGGELHLLDMLPLSRTPAIQQSGQEDGGAFRLGGSDEEEERQDHGFIAEADDRYEEEYKHPYPVYSISKSRPHALTSDSSTLQPSQSLFRLPNRDISTAPGAIPISSLIPSFTSGAHSSDDPTSPGRPLPSLSIKQQQTQSEGRHDPIERFLLAHGALQPLRDQQQQLLADPAQQQLQRTRSVASWAQEQALIHEKRSKHRARAQASKELREQDTMATLLSMHSDDSSALLEFSSSSSSSPWSGDEPLELSRLEIVIREQDEEGDEEELGMYMDTDDIVSPSVEVESLGAGVGRPSFR